VWLGVGPVMWSGLPRCAMGSFILRTIHRCWRDNPIMRSSPLSQDHGLVTLGRGVPRGTAAKPLCRPRHSDAADPVRAAVLRIALAAGNYFGQARLVLSDPTAIETRSSDGARGPAAAVCSRDRWTDRGQAVIPALFADPPGGAARPVAALRGSLHSGGHAARSICARQPGCSARGVAAGAAFRTRRTGSPMDRRLDDRWSRRHHGLHVIWKLWNWGWRRAR